MTEIVGPELQYDRFISGDPSNGVLAALDGAAVAQNLIAWSPVTGDVTHTAPAGTGSNTRIHQFDRPISVAMNVNAASYTINGVAVVAGWYAAQNTKGLIVQNSGGSNKVAVTLDGSNVWQFGDGLLAAFNAGISVTGGTSSFQALTATTGTFSGNAVISTGNSWYAPDPSIYADQGFLWSNRGGITRTAGFAYNFSTNSVASAFFISDSGNVGIKVIPATWNAAYEGRVVQFGPGGTLFASDVTSTFLGANYYINSAGIDKFLGTGFAANVFLTGGSLTLRVSNASGVLDGSITWVNAITIAAATGIVTVAAAALFSALVTANLGIVVKGNGVGIAASQAGFIHDGTSTAEAVVYGNAAGTPGIFTIKLRSSNASIDVAGLIVTTTLATFPAAVRAVGDITSDGFLVTGHPDAGGNGSPWKFGAPSVISPTAPNRTVKVNVNGAILYFHAKTSND